MFLSVFDLFKIGIGPSSSHTVGPMVAASRFLDEILNGDWPRPASDGVAHISVSLHGSLAFTGKGHATDHAIILGLAGKLPSKVTRKEADSTIASVTSKQKVSPDGHPDYKFSPQNDLIFDYDTILPGHSNGMTFNAYAADGRMLLKRVYYSVGGGFILSEEELAQTKENNDPALVNVPFPFENADQMLAMAKNSGLSISKMKLQNETISIGAEALSRDLLEIWAVMKSCVELGFAARGELPGGLKVKRRAGNIRDKLLEEWQNNKPNPLLANDWLQAFAMAVNEENAAGGRVVTAPTNGAAGVIPATLSYYLKFFPEADDSIIEEFLLTASAIGGIIKHNASISGAEVGCQGEIGAASAMAAAGLAAIMGGNPAQVENAAEIALEHHLGMTCDPIGGLVQVPCIERNGMGAIKAVSAASLALKGDGTHFVSLDACIKTMRDTGHDMNARYKETSLGGLAVNVVEC